MKPLIMTICAGCAEKVKNKYILQEIEEEQRYRQCALCLQVCYASRYEISPRRPRYSRPKPGGGERRRAGE